MHLRKQAVSDPTSFCLMVSSLELLSGAQLVAARVRVCGKRLETFKSAAQRRWFGLLSKLACGLEGQKHSGGGLAFCLSWLLA